jgi:hypothetical protein
VRRLRSGIGRLRSIGTDSSIGENVRCDGILNIGEIDMSATLVTIWKAMKVTRVGLRHWRTAPETATGTLTFDDGTNTAFGDIVLPATEVHIHIFYTFPVIGTVDACQAIGIETDGSLVIALDPEPVAIESTGIIAQSMPAIATYTTANGDIWTSKNVVQPDGFGCFPNCPFVNGVAQQVQASFVLEKQ